MYGKKHLLPHPTPWRAHLFHVIFGTDTPAGKLFDIALLVAIVLSVVAVSLETVDTIKDYHGYLFAAEWCFTILFTIEYVLRLLAVRRPIRYARSFFGIVDLLSFLPTYICWLIPGAQTLLVLRTMRLIRVFRILKLWRFLSEAEVLSKAVWDARAKIIVFLITVLIIVTISGAAMYWVEHNMGGTQFTSIPQAIYWAVVTMTTVGYGDVVPQTTLGKVLSAVLILVGYSLIIVPTGFVSAEFAGRVLQRHAGRECPSCEARGHQPDARFCRKCGGEL